jgi:hypothetical protein
MIASTKDRRGFPTPSDTWFLNTALLLAIHHRTKSIRMSEPWRRRRRRKKERSERKGRERRESRSRRHRRRPRTLRIPALALSITQIPRSRRDMIPITTQSSPLLDRDRYLLRPFYLTPEIPKPILYQFVSFALLLPLRAARIGLALEGLEIAPLPVNQQLKRRTCSPLTSPTHLNRQVSCLIYILYITSGRLLHL